MWWFRWHARRFFRSVMNPIKEEAAIRWHRRLRFLYIFVGFNALIISYKVYKRKEDNKDSVQDVTTAHKKARLMELGDVRIIRAGIGIPTQTFDINSERYSREFNEKLKASKENIEILKE